MTARRIAAAMAAQAKRESDDAHLLLALLDEARKGQVFPIGLYPDGRERVRRIFDEIHAQLAAERAGGWKLYDHPALVAVFVDRAPFLGRAQRRRWRDRRAGKGTSTRAIDELAPARVARSSHWHPSQCTRCGEPWPDPWGICQAMQPNGSRCRAVVCDTCPTCPVHS